MTEETKQTRMQKRQDRKMKKEKPVQEELPQDVLTEQPIVSIGFASWITRILIVVALFLVVALVGSMIGYGVIGDGNPLQVLNPGTWTHIFDIMNGKMD